MARILLMGDASNYHRALAEGLRRRGHNVTVASAGSGWMNTGRDITLRRPLSGKAGGMLLWLDARYLSRRRLAGYDIVQLSNVDFINLRPHRKRAIFDMLRRQNGSIYLTALGTDTPYVRYAMQGLRYSEFQVDGHPSPHDIAHPEVRQVWLTEPLASYTEHVYRHVDGVATALYEYHEAVVKGGMHTRVQYCGIPIDTRALPFSGPTEPPARVRMLLARHRTRQAEKGTDILLRAARDVVAQMPERAELAVVENIPYAQFVDLLGRHHVVLDQLYSYTPATTALLAMARGAAAVSGGEAEYYDFIGEHTDRPVINVRPGCYDDIVATLADVVTHPERLPALARQGRAFVERHNDTEVVARRFEQLWGL